MSYPSCNFTNDEKYGCVKHGILINKEDECLKDKNCTGIVVQNNGNWVKCITESSQAQYMDLYTNDINGYYRKSSN